MKNTLTRFETNTATTPGTHVYKARYSQAQEAIFEVATALGFQVKTHNETHKECLLKAGNVEIIVTVVNESVVESSIDLTVITPFLKSGKKVATAFFVALNKRL